MSRLSTHQSFLHPNIGVSDSRINSPDAPAWIFAIPGVSQVVNRLGILEFRRRLFHMSPALLPVVLPFVPHRDVWGPTLIGLLIVASIVALVVAFQFASKLKRTSNENWMRAVLGYMVPVVSSLLLFPGRAELGLMTLQIVALGDGSATFGGLMLRGRRLPWNRKKTFSGMFCFVVVGTLAATYSYWGEARPGVPVLTAFLICVVAATMGAIVESLPIRTNDNLRVGLTALSAGFVMSSLIA
jgi:dolichol kinase